MKRLWTICIKCEKLIEADKTHEILVSNTEMSIFSCDKCLQKMKGGKK